MAARLATWSVALPRRLRSRRRPARRPPRRLVRRGLAPPWRWLVWRRLAVPWRWIGRRPRLAVGAAAGLLLVAAGARFGPAGWSWLEHHPYFALEEIMVSPTHHVHPGELLQFADVRPGMSIWRFPAAVLAARLTAHPWVRAARVRRELPRRLVIDVVEREPVAVVMLGGLFYVDRFGVVFAPLGPRERLDLPLITGVRGAGMPIHLAMRHALKALRFVEAAALPFRVSEVHIDEEQGVQVFPVEPPVAVTLGWGRLKTKTERLGEVLTAFAGRETEIREIDLTFRAQAVIRLRRG
jgi:cell division protein FtsQ